LAKGVDGVGLAALGLGSALMWAGIKGYSLLMVLENLVTGRPMTGGKMAHRLTIDQPAASGRSGGRSSPEGLIDPPIIDRR